MSRSFDIHVNSFLPDIMRQIDKKKVLALSAMGDIVEGYAKEDCPVDTGLLRNSITHGPGDGAPKISSYSADRPKNGIIRTGTYSNMIGGESDGEYVGTNVEYAPYIEFNSDITHLSGKAHFLRDAAQGHITEMKNTAEAIFSKL